MGLAVFRFSRRLRFSCWFWCCIFRLPLDILDRLFQRLPSRRTVARRQTIHLTRPPLPTTSDDDRSRQTLSISASTKTSNALPLSITISSLTVPGIGSLTEFPLTLLFFLFRNLFQTRIVFKLRSSRATRNISNPAMGQPKVKK